MDFVAYHLGPTIDHAQFCIKVADRATSDGGSRSWSDYLGSSRVTSSVIKSFLLAFVHVSPSIYRDTGQLSPTESSQNIATPQPERTKSEPDGQVAEAHPQKRQRVSTEQTQPQETSPAKPSEKKTIDVNDPSVLAHVRVMCMMLRRWDGDVEKERKRATKEARMTLRTQRKRHTFKR